MTWTAPKTWASGDVLTAADMNTYVRDNARWLGFNDTSGHGAPIARVRRTGAQTGVATNTAISFLAADINVGEALLWSGGAPTKLLMGGSGQVGYYLFGGNVRLDLTYSSGVGIHGIYLRYNGATVFAEQRGFVSSSQTAELTVASIYQVQATNDYVEELVQWQNYTNVDVAANADSSAVLWGLMLGGTNN